MDNLLDDLRQNGDKDIIMMMPSGRKELCSVFAYDGLLWIKNGKKSVKVDFVNESRYYKSKNLFVIDSELKFEN